MANKKLNRVNNDQPHLLIEGPRWGDAAFYGGWLLEAAKANKLWIEGKRDPVFAKQVERLEVCYFLDFGVMATILLRKLLGLSTMIVALDSEDAETVAMMAGMGFFVLTGERYQMTVPTKLDLATVKRALLDLTETEDSECMFHPERLVATMSRSSAVAWQDRLGDMDEDLRVADRHLLLEDTGLGLGYRTAQGEAR